jgi:hypothetical protein
MWCFPDISCTAALLAGPGERGVPVAMGGALDGALAVGAVRGSDCVRE